MATTGKKSHSWLYRFVIKWQVARAYLNPEWNAETLRNFAASLKGVLPTLGGGGGIILAACDNYYYAQFAPTLLLSLNKQGGGQAVHLHLYRPSDEVLRHVQNLRNSLTKIELTWTADPCLLAQEMPFDAVYFTSARLLMADLILRQSGRPVLCIDVDGIAVRPVWPAYAPSCEGGDVGLIFRRRSPRPWRRILASAVGLNPSRSGKRFASTVARTFAGLYQHKPPYHVDQIVLHYAASWEVRRRSPARFFDMPRVLSDYEFQEDGVIWTAKGWRNKSSALFQSLKLEVESTAPDLAKIDVAHADR